jgi:hypothetical protein
MTRIDNFVEKSGGKFILKDFFFNLLFYDFNGLILNNLIPNRLDKSRLLGRLSKDILQISLNIYKTITRLTYIENIFIDLFPFGSCT